MMQSPPPYVPVVEYVLKALEHPPYMYVAKLAACCTMLFLTREDPDLLKELCHKWALRFRHDRVKLIEHIRKRASYCINSPDPGTELERSSKAVSDDVVENGTEDESGGNDDSQQQQKQHQNGDEVFGGIRCCEPDRAVEHLLSILNTLVPMYFSWNWHRADYVIQINKEYEAYVREFILPVCAALAPEDGMDDMERTPWLLPPHTYLDSSQNTSGFYSPTSNVGLYPVTKSNSRAEAHRLSGSQSSFGGGGSGGGGAAAAYNAAGPLAYSSPTISAAASAGGSPNSGRAEMEGLSYSSLQHHFSSATTSHHRNGDRLSVAGALPLPKFSPVKTKPHALDTSLNGLPNGAALPTALTPQAAAAASAGGSVNGIPAMSPNAMSAGVFTAAAVYGLRFLSLGTYRDALKHNTKGLVTIFHAKYSARSNEVIDALQTITSRRLLNPMPTIAVVYAVAEPELSSLYKVGWFPTIVYTPPLSCQECSAQHRGAQQQHSTHSGGRTQPIDKCPAQRRSSHHYNDRGIHRSPVAAAVRKLQQQHPQHTQPTKMGAHGLARSRKHSHSHHRRQRSTTRSASASQPRSCSRHMSNSRSLLEVADADAAVRDGAAAYEEEERAKWDVANESAATPVTNNSLNAPPAANSSSTGAGTSMKNNCVATAASYAVVGLQSLRGEKVSEAAAPLSAASVMAAGMPSHLSATAGGGGGNRCDGSPVASVRSAVTGPLSANAPMTPTPTELLFGISVSEAALSQADNSTSQVNSNSLTNSSFHSSVADSVQPFTEECRRRQEPLIDMVERDDHVIYPMQGDLTVPALVEWISARGASVPRLGKMQSLSTCIKAIRQEEKFKRFRELHSAVVTLRRLQGQGGGDPSRSSSDPYVGGASTSSNNGNSNSSSSRQQAPDQPLFIFLGGGMAAGKTTAVAALATSEWWQGHKEQSVVVNADEFKLPLECEMSSVEAHKHSTRAAEKLLVKATNQGRSIVLDGTMMWRPFVQQVVQMVRDAHLTLFKQGPGYDKHTQVERYFVADKARQPPLPMPYKIIFLGITVDVETAVPRGFLRKFSTNRGVPISMQLRSFKMFSENFADYVAMVDQTTLYNNNVFVNLEKGELPPVMAECNERTNHKLVIHDEAAFQQFIRQQQINENADNVMQVYPSSPVTPGA